MPAGRHFLQIPGPTNVPDRVLRAIDRPTIDHRGPEFQALGQEVLAGIRRIVVSTYQSVSGWGAAAQDEDPLHDPGADGFAPDKFPAAIWLCRSQASRRRS